MPTLKNREKQVAGRLNHRNGFNQESPKVLELVLKADEAGTLEAAEKTLLQIDVPGVTNRIIHKGVGSVSQSDLLMAQTASRLVVGFNSGVAPSLKKHIQDTGVEVRLYDVIYTLSKDIEEICQRLIPSRPNDTIIGNAEIIATFKAGKGMIIGCRITDGTIALGKHFRIISAMGPVYTGTVESLQIENKAVREGHMGQQVGIHLPDWKKAKIGDYVECFEKNRSGNREWEPKPGIFQY
jgi:translation initiation factor IF-2